MSPRQPARIRRRRVAALLVALAALVAVLADQRTASSTPSLPWLAPAAAPEKRERRGADEALPPGTTVSDTELAGVADLDPKLRKALRRAAADAPVELEITSGRRSRAYQRRLLDEAIATYGSEQEAARWVATADTSPHVSGDAVDLGPQAATTWLAANGAAYGLCPIYGNEPWHYELRPQARTDGCPPLYPDPTHDPRLHP